MSWIKHMTMHRSKSLSPKSEKQNGSGSKGNYASYLPDVYTGISNRVDRYKQYDQMDQDPEIRTALDILADFCTQNSEDFDIPLEIKYKDKMGDSEVTTIEDRLESWAEQNRFKTRMYEIVRGVLKYGDQFYIRDPETYELYYVNPMNVQEVLVNESQGKEPLIYFVKDVQANIHDKVATSDMYGYDKSTYNGSNIGTSSTSQYGGGSNTSVGTSQAGTGSAFNTGGQLDVLPVAAEHVIHISLNTGLDPFWPFGTSILENIFKTYKQKELLEDSVIIYRVQRAPERRVFKIDTGDMLPHQAMATVERFKTEMHQRRLPSNKGGTTTLMDTAYNPLSILEDFFFPQTSEGKGSSVETLPGGDNLGQIDDLRYFNNKLIRGLSIPSSYLPFGPEDGGTVFSDGGVGRALIQEHRFNKQCQRHQNIIAEKIDEEFKRYMIHAGYNINPNSFEVVFKPPMNFASYRKTELDATMINTYLPLNELPFIAKQTILQKMGFSQDEIIENERLWLQENPDSPSNSNPDDAAGLQSVGISAPNAENDLTMPDEDLGTENSTDTDGFDPNNLGSTF